MVKMSAQINLYLRINEEFQNTLYKGDPALLSIAASNTATMEDEQLNRYLDDELNRLNESLEKEEISEEEYNAEKERLESQRVEVEAPEIGADGAPWYEAIRFHVGKDEEWEPLTWKLELFHSSPQEDSVKLTSVTQAYAEYSMSPEAVDALPEGVYEIKATLGEAESNVIMVGVSKDADPEPTQDKMVFVARYLMAAGALTAAQTVIEQLTKDQPSSTQSHIMMGEYYAAAEEYEKALESFKLALKAFKRENPDEYEPPVYIESMIAELALLTGAVDHDENNEKTTEQ